MGTKDYLPDQIYSLMDYEQAQPVIDTSVLNGRRPWYSGKYNDDIKSGATTAWGNTQTDPYGAAEEAGSKQYELTNHLGDVQATVSDNRYEVADKSTDSVVAYHPALRSAYDYYPFGMLMPGRYVSDTSEHCVTISRPAWAWKEVTVACWDVLAWVWPGYTRVGEGAAVVDGDAVEINAPNAGDAVSFDYPVTIGLAQELEVDIDRVSLNSSASIQIKELQGKDWVTLAETPVNVVSGGIKIPFMPTTNTIRVVWNGKILVWVRKACISRLEWVEDNQLVTICNGDKDKYRFGFNGQEKVNEWAGIGNYLDYKRRGLDTRLGRFLAVDPLTKEYPNLTPYQFASNTPIWAVDRDGEEARVYTETKGTGHTFLTVLDGKDITVYTYGRYAGGHWYTGGTTGPGVLVRYTGKQASNYIKTELYRMNAKAFEIKDADQNKVKAYMDKLYNSSKEVPNTDDPNIKKYGRVVNTYSLFGCNCTTTSSDALKSGGTDIFDAKGLLYDYDEDFTIPSSLQKFLSGKTGSDPNVIDVTSQMKKKFPNTDSKEPLGSAGISGTSSGSSGASSGSSANSSSTDASSSGNGSGSSGSGSGSSSSQDYDKP